ncbi:MAG: tetratricopeptide repeat protein [Burkholderiales bacterium]|nr:tetratricopeptide repeat protein [Burkholderiales bacterium]
MGTSLLGGRPAERRASVAVAERLERARREYALGSLDAVLRTLEPATAEFAAALGEVRDDSAEALRTGRAVASAWALLARAAARSDRADLAREAAGHAAAAFDSLRERGATLTAEETVDRTIALYLAGRLDEAAAAMRDAADLSGVPLEMYVYQGEAESRLGEAEKSLAALARAEQVEGPDLQLLRLHTRAAVLVGLGPDRLGDAVRAYFELGDHQFRAGRYSEALASLERARALNPRDVFVLAGRGEVLEVMGRLDEAIAAFDEALTELPTLSWALARKGEAARRLGRSDEALDALDRSLALDPDEAVALVSKGELLRLKGQYDDAARTLERALRANPGDSWALGVYGETLRQAGRYEEAADALARAIERDPRNAQTRVRYGETLRLLGRRDEAVAAIDAAIAISPDDVWTLGRKAAALRDAERFDEALVVLNRALEIDPDDASMLASKGETLRLLQRYDDALLALERALRASPDDAWTLSVYGETLRGAGRWQEAADVLSRAIVADPGNAQTHARYGEALRLLGRRDEAMAAIDAALAIRGDDVWILCRKAAVLRDAGRNEEALAVLDRALEIEADDVDALAKRGDTLRLLDRHEEALRDLSRAIALAPDDSWSRSRRGDTLRMLNRYDESLADLDKALATAKGDTLTWALASKGGALRAMGRLRESEDVMREALRLDPGYFFARTGLAHALLDQGREHEALEQLDEVLTGQPDYVWALEGKSLALQKLDDIAGGLVSVKRLLDVDPGSAWARGVYGVMLFQIEDYVGACRELEASIATNANLAWVQSALADSYGRLAAGKLPSETGSILEKAVTASRDAVRLEPADVTWRAALAESLRRLAGGQSDEARAEYRHVLEACQSKQNLDFYEAKSAGWAAFQLAAADASRTDSLLSEAERLTVAALAAKKDRPESADAIEAKGNLALVILCSQRYALGLREYEAACASARTKQPEVRRGLIGRARTDLQEAQAQWPRLEQSPHSRKALQYLDEAYSAEGKSPM